MDGISVSSSLPPRAGHFIASARRFRPSRFDLVLGQPHIVRAIVGALTMGRIAPAYLFSGPRGVGKTTVARLIAKAVNCTRRAGAEPCNTCDSCVAISRGVCIDVLEIDAASHTGVDNMRDVCETVRFPPATVGTKVVIIDECHMLSKGAFNAFLKTLEEPPSHVIFVMATTEIEKVPDTIKSRCQQFRFVPARIGDLVASLERVLNERGGAGLAPGQRQRLLTHIAKAADGSFRDALSLLDQMLSLIGGDGDVDEALSVLGVTPWSMAKSLVDCIVAGDAARALKTLDDYMRAGQEPQQVVGGLTEYLRAVMLAHVSPGLLDLALLPEEAAPMIAHHAGAMTLDHILRAIDLCWAAGERFRQDADQRTVVEAALVKACALRDTVQLPRLVERLAALEQGRGPRPVGKAARAGSLVEPPPGAANADPPSAAAAVPTNRRPPVVDALIELFDGSVVE